MSVLYKHNDEIERVAGSYRPYVINPRPDWSNAVAISLEQLKTGYTTPSDGMIVGTVEMQSSLDSAGHYSLTINNVAVGSVMVTQPGSYDNADITCVVNENDIIKISGATFPIESYLSFVPWKE